MFSLKIEMFLFNSCTLLRKSTISNNGIWNLLNYFKSSSRFFGSTMTYKSKSLKVAVLGAGGKTGSALSYFLKHCSLIDELAIYDIHSVHSIAMELNHIHTKCHVTTDSPDEYGLKNILEESKIVIITAGLPLSDENNCQNKLKINGNILKKYISNIIRICPRALVAIATNPINQLIPFTAELYKAQGIFDNNHLFGITALDCVRANTFAAETLGLEPECIVVPVIGGSCSRTRIPLFSQTLPCNKFTNEEISKLTYAVRMAEAQVTKENKGTKEKTSLAMGFAAARFCMSLCKGLQDQRGVVECAYVCSNVLPEVTYFSAPIELGPDGIQGHLGIPKLSTYECKFLKDAIPIIKNDIKSGQELAWASRDI